MRVAILGASRKPDRYSNKAFLMLRAHGHEVVPVHPVLDTIDGVEVRSSLDEISGSVDTLTLYVGSRHIVKESDAIVRLAPRRVIFNPGTESAPLEKALDEAGIPYLKACTLVLLSTGQFATAGMPAGV